jgi:hypothetical protein
VTNYIERRPEAIEAIHKSIVNTWLPRVDGGHGEYDNYICETGEDGCCGGCYGCPVYISTGLDCNKPGSYFDNWYKSSGADERKKASGEYLEALVMLLPPEHRIRYGG